MRWRRLVIGGMSFLCTCKWFVWYKLGLNVVLALYFLSVLLYRLLSYSFLLFFSNFHRFSVFVFFPIVLFVLSIDFSIFFAFFQFYHNFVRFFIGFSVFLSFPHWFICLSLLFVMDLFSLCPFSRGFFFLFIDLPSLILLFTDFSSFLSILRFSSRRFQTLLFSPSPSFPSNWLDFIFLSIKIKMVPTLADNEQICYGIWRFDSINSLANKQTNTHRKHLRIYSSQMQTHQ